MSNKPLPDEQPKKRVAKRVITPKRLYFMPETGMVIEAADAVEAGRLHAKKRKKVQKEQEVGE